MWAVGGERRVKGAVGAVDRRVEANWAVVALVEKYEQYVEIGSDER